MLNCFDGFSRLNLSRLIYIYIYGRKRIMLTRLCLALNRVDRFSYGQLSSEMDWRSDSFRFRHFPMTIWSHRRKLPSLLLPLLLVIRHPMDHCFRPHKLRPSRRLVEPYCRSRSTRIVYRRPELVPDR